MCCCFFFKQKTAYEMRISDWSSDVCSSDLRRDVAVHRIDAFKGDQLWGIRRRCLQQFFQVGEVIVPPHLLFAARVADRSEEHTSELQSLMRISYAVFCLKTKIKSDKYS